MLSRTQANVLATGDLYFHAFSDWAKNLSKVTVQTSSVQIC